MPKNGSQGTPADRFAAIEFMIGHLFRSLYERSGATPEMIAESQRKLREQYQSTNLPEETKEALDQLLDVIASIAGTAPKTKGHP
jgi:hypothetical protein